MSPLRSQLRVLGFILLVSLPVAGQAAITVLDEKCMVWDFTLSLSGAGSDSLDQFYIDFGDDKLEAGDVLSVTVQGSGQSLPVISKTLSRSGAGRLGGFLFILDLNNAFPDLNGTVRLELLQGSVDIEALVFLLKTPSGNIGSNVRQTVHLVPEPSIAVLAGVGAAFASLRRRRIGSVTHSEEQHA